MAALEMDSTTKTVTELERIVQLLTTFLQEKQLFGGEFAQNSANFTPGGVQMNMRQNLDPNLQQRIHILTGNNAAATYAEQLGRQIRKEPVDPWQTSPGNADDYS